MSKVKLWIRGSTHFPMKSGNQLHQVIQDKHHTIFRSQGAFEDQTNTEIEKLAKRLFSVEKAVRLPPSSDAQGPIGC